MFYHLMFKRCFPKYRKSCFNILCIFTLSMMMFTFMNIYASSTLYYTHAVEVPYLTRDWTCDFRIINASEEQAAYFRGVDGVRVEYRDGNIEFHLADSADADAVWEEVEQIHIEKIKAAYRGPIEDYPSIYTYVGKTGLEGIVDYIDHIDQIHHVIWFFQAVLAVPGLATMVMIYRDYIVERTPDIRTLIGLGISRKQLRRLFFSECVILYGISLVVGFLLGAGLAYLLFSGARGIEPTQSTTEYPVFHIDLLSLLLPLALSWLSVFITFLVMMRRIRKIDASYTCMETESAFPEKNRAYYQRADGRFVTFFSAVLRKRGSGLGRVQNVLVSYSVAVAVFAMNAINYLVAESVRFDGVNRIVIVQSIANNSVFFMLGFFVFLFSLAVIRIFTKRHAEACAEPVGILYALGAEEKDVFACFRRLTVRNQIVSLTAGLAVGYAITILIFRLAGYAFSVNFWFILAHFLLVGVFALVAWISAKTSYGKNCRNDPALLRQED
ncbi:MAG: FtsX-like permease family protein [Ruminococcaceae bacterium]|nr:FtsX-like permease family protein [Oscillospiraceae bacterium]